MSSARHSNARHFGYEGPLFPLTTDYLGNMLGSLNLSKEQLGAIAARLPGFSGMTKPVTTDNYYWLCGLRIASGEGEALILIPHARDAAQQGGTQLDRSVAVYTKNLRESEAGAILTRFTSEVHEEANRLNADKKGWE